MQLIKFLSPLRYDNSCDLKTDSRPLKPACLIPRRKPGDAAGFNCAASQPSPSFTLVSDRGKYFSLVIPNLFSDWINDNFTKINKFHDKFLSVLPNVLAGKVIGEKNRRAIFGVPGSTNSAPLALPLNHRNGETRRFSLRASICDNNQPHRGGFSLYCAIAKRARERAYPQICRARSRALMKLFLVPFLVRSLISIHADTRL